MTFFMSLSLLFVASVILDNNLSVAETGRVSLHRYRRAACDPKYSEINPQHSMCLDDVGTPVTLTQAEKQSIVDMHNNLRELQDLPQATNMQKIVWDEDIAKVASKWVNQCGSGATAHEDSSDKREVPSLPGVHIGQNAANGYATFEDAVQGWYDEVKDFSYGQTMEIGLIGHFTQIVNANVARIGCGKAMCNGTPHYVCDYAKAQMFDELSKPYETGSIAAQCPNNVDSSGKLCDCGGKICLNGGTIDLATCTCACLTLYKGSDCSELNCPANDGQFCNNGYEKAHCGIYSNVPTECPYMCDICQAGSSCNLNCQNGGILDSVNCRCTCVGDYSGDQCETAPLCTLTCDVNGDLISSGTECRCQCRNGYTGTNCQTPPPCTLTCDVNGDLISSGTECRCQCRNGYTGTNCQTPPPCTLSCDVNGDLISSGTECRCQCRNGYTGTNCQTPPPCTLSCDVNGDLISSGTECRCQCRNGYTGTNCQTPPPCTLSCGDNGDLISTNTECRCQCRNGYTGTTCLLAPPCDLNCESNGDLIQSNSGCTCQCRNNYVGARCEIAPTLECRRTCKNDGVLNSVACTCSCPAGYSGLSCEVAPPNTCGFSCANGGKLRSTECQCDCPDRYTGFSCGVDLCSTRDHPWCTYINIGQPSTCNDGLKRFCPTKCGLCGEQQAPTCLIPCRNGGRLDFARCRCICQFGFWGPACQLRRPT
ncbi:fibropellin-1 isoform X2 [Patella vulgata]|uniref:fibropellin-1 isoform X2 n=1 Tax=Patella vulgata TaxID=6465 RepID=UPI002180861D|nr:fibropellin-1 isoform X2 [Patella vulgata]